MLTTPPPTTAPPRGGAVRWRGLLTPELLADQSQRGRRRRWVYAAAGDADVVVGAAVVDVGLLGLGTAFAFAVDAAGTHLWDAGPGWAGRVDGVAGRALLRRGSASVELEQDRLRLDVPLPEGGRLVADVALAASTPVSLLTPTPGGGWNATTKSAGGSAAGPVRTPAGAHELRGGSWTDATHGRQDRRTTWRWAAGAGRARDGRRVGIQASTGMNASGPGEDVVWWDGEPVPLEVTLLAPADDAAPREDWVLAGPGWRLSLAVAGVRAADEGLGPIRSRYVQPVGTWHGTLPGPDGAPVEVSLRGVAEDHEARW